MEEFVIAKKSDIVAIADAIRSKTGSTETYSLEELPNNIINYSQLNFTVLGGTTTPTSPRENTIWVDTDDPISCWTFAPSIQTPDNPVEGMVWINVLDNSSGGFNALLENSIEIYPSTAQQYISGEWVKKTMQIYQNEGWVHTFSATINVTYPIGTVCSCSNGEVNLVASDTSGSYSFTVPFTGVWTLIATRDNNISKPTEVEITNDDDGQTKSATIPVVSAIIEVTYPKGTCTCTLEGSTYTHSGGGTATFTVNAAGTWTINAVYNTISRSSTATISSDSQTVNISISYTTYLFNTGDECTDITDGWSAVGDYGTVENDGTYLRVHAGYGAYAAYLTNNPIDLTDFSTLKATVKGSGGNEKLLGIASSRSTSFTDYTEFLASEDTIMTLDISSYKASYYVGIRSRYNNSVYARIVQLEV